MTHAEYDCDELIAILRDFRARHPHLRLILEPGSVSPGARGIWCRRSRILSKTAACIRPSRCVVRLPHARLPRNALQARHCRGARARCRGKALAHGRYELPRGRYYGDWAFDHELKVGERIVFEDMIHYTMVKTTMFNGVAHPAIVIVRRDGPWTSSVSSATRISGTACRKQYKQR